MLNHTLLRHGFAVGNVGTRRLERKTPFLHFRMATARRVDKPAWARGFWDFFGCDQSAFQWRQTFQDLCALAIGLDGVDSGDFRKPCDVSRGLGLGTLAPVVEQSAQGVADFATRTLHPFLLGRFGCRLRGRQPREYRVSHLLGLDGNFARKL